MASATVNTLRELGGVLRIAVLGAVLTDRMTDGLTSALHRLGVPPEAVGPVAAAPTGAVHGGGAAGALPEPVRQAVDGTFVDGIHLALRCGSVALAVTAVLVAVLVGRARPLVPAAPGGPRPEERAGAGVA
ncbi:hypothetical protein [Kitasatospora sp. NPDC018619]|uniref:hypothetical protein n=1 Tax=unclassified Kitasatospora TaxID=2633591 RepID=UPI0037B0D378